MTIAILVIMIAYTVFRAIKVHCDLYIIVDEYKEHIELQQQLIDLQRKRIYQLENKQTMKPTHMQLTAIETLEEKFGIKVDSDFGHLSNGDIRLVCSDRFGEYAMIIDRKGNYQSLH